MCQSSAGIRPRVVRTDKGHYLITGLKPDSYDQRERRLFRLGEEHSSAHGPKQGNLSAPPEWQHYDQWHLAPSKRNNHRL
jgi:hypothetical protein